MIRLGLVGCGVIGRKHLEAARALDGACVAAVADLDETLARDAAAAFAVDRFTTRADELIEDPAIDGIILAVPTGVRAALARRVLEQGKHLLLEKPVAMNAGEVRELLALQGDRIAACCSCRFRFIRTAPLVQEALRNGRIGRLRTIRVQALFPPAPTRPENPPPWRLIRRLNGGGILVNWGSYDLDFVLGVLGWSFSPETACARTFGVPAPWAGWIAPGSDAETHVIAQIHGANGTVLDYERAEFHPGRRVFDWSFSGDQGTLTVRIGDKDIEVSLVTANADGTLKTEIIGEEPVDHAAMHAGPVTDFVNSIRNGCPPMTPLNHALTAARITDSIYASAARGGLEQPVH
ncbi:MAG: Gfo/Idh/MocA family oxidoreductase [Opitutaceae bacterium]